MSGASPVVVATLNVRNTADRWRERAPLLVEQLEALAPHVIALQEVRRVPDQAGRIAPEGWHGRRTFKTGPKRLWEGLAVLSRLPVDGRAARSRLRGQSRVAQRVTVALPDGHISGATLDVYNVHLADGDETVRARQARRLLEWMDERPDQPAVLMGDFNSRPRSAPVQILTARLRSAYAEVHGREPSRTVVTGGVLDYVYVNDRVTVLDARLAFDQPSPADPRLFPSDHFGLAVTISVTATVTGRPPAPAPA